MTLFLFLGLVSTSAYTGEKFQPEAMWPQLTQNGRSFNYPTGIARDLQGLFYITNTGSHKIKVLTADGELLRAWGGIGDQPGQFNDPMNIVISASGEVFVADFGNHRIQVFNANGQFLRQWGSHGTLDGQLNHPTNLVIDKQDHIIVSDTENDRIQVFDKMGHWLLTLGDGLLSAPRGIAFSPTGELYVAESSAHRISIFNAKGVYLRSFGNKGTELGQFEIPNNLAFDAQGLLYVTDHDNNRIQVFNAQNEIVRSWDNLNGPYGLFINNKTNTVYVTDSGSNSIIQTNLQGDFKKAWQTHSDEIGKFSNPSVSVSPEGNIYVADSNNHRIQVFSPSGTLLQSIGELGDEPGQFNYPIAVVFDKQQVYINDFSNNRIQVFDLQGHYIRHFEVFGSDKNQQHVPDNMFTHQGLIYGTDYLNHRVQVYTLDGTWVRGWGRKGTDQGKFDEPSGIVVDNEGLVYVADRWNHRIQIFDNKGTFLNQWGKQDSENNELSAPNGLAISSGGLLYISGFLDNRIQVFQRDGKFIESIGEAGTQAGQFGQPRSIALIDEETLVVGEIANNRIQVLSRRKKKLPSYKAIILAGGGSSTATHFNALWDSTQLLSNNAYFALRAQGYNKDSIKFLSSGNLNNDLDENGLADDLESASLASLEQSITGWASDTEDVLIYLVDHGGPGTFKINQQEILSRERLKQWIDSLQSQINGKITVVIEACQSASFFDGLGAKNRILIASADKQQPAVISNQGMTSFSYHFWYAIHTGQPLQQAFKKARQGISHQNILVNNIAQKQNAQLDADGNGIFNQADNTALGDYCLGSCQQLAADEPQLTLVTASTTLNGETSFNLSVQVTSLAPINTTWATISRPDTNHTDLSQPITNLPQLLLSCIEQSAGNYHCQGEYSEFDVNGDYSITFHARDTQARTSVPNAFITIKQTAGKENTLSTSDYSTIYNDKTGIVTLLDVKLDDNQHYRVTLQKTSKSFVLTSAVATAQKYEIPANFSSKSGLLVIPEVEINGHTYLANLQLQAAEDFIFELITTTDLGFRQAEK